MNDVVLNPEQPIAAYNPIVAAIAELRKRHANVEFDVTTTEGMDAAKKARADIREPRYKIEHIRKQLKAPALAYSRRIDDEAKRYTAELLELEKPIDEQIKAEEQRKEREKAEAERLEHERNVRINAVVSDMQFLPVYAKPKTAAEVQTLIDELEGQAVNPDEYGERLTEVVHAKSMALTALRNLHAEKLDDEARAAEEAERLQREREELASAQAELARQRAELERLQASVPVPHAPVDPEPEPIAAHVEPDVIAYFDDDDPFSDLVKADHNEPPLPKVPTRAELVKAIADHWLVSTSIAEQWLEAAFNH